MSVAYPIPSARVMGEDIMVKVKLCRHDTIAHSVIELGLIWRTYSMVPYSDH